MIWWNFRKARRVESWQMRRHNSQYSIWVYPSTVSVFSVENVSDLLCVSPTDSVVLSKSYSLSWFLYYVRRLCVCKIKNDFSNLVCIKSLFSSLVPVQLNWDFLILSYTCLAQSCEISTLYTSYEQSNQANNTGTQNMWKCQPDCNRIRSKPTAIKFTRTHMSV